MSSEHLHTAIGRPAPPRHAHSGGVLLPQAWCLIKMLNTPQQNAQCCSLLLKGSSRDSSEWVFALIAKDLTSLLTTLLFLLAINKGDDEY